MGVFKLIENGCFGLESTLGDLLPEIPERWSKAEITHLLSHSSGIKNYTDPKQYWKETQLDVPKERILEYVWAEPMEFDPGEKYKFCNTGYYLLGLIIEKFSNQSYFDFVNSELLSRTDKIVPTDTRVVLQNRAVGYRRSKLTRKLTKVEYYSNSGTFSAGGFSASVRGFLEFERALFGGKIISPESLKSLMKVGLSNDGEELAELNVKYDFRMAHGVFVFKNGLMADGKYQIGNAGNTTGFSSSYIRLPSEDLSASVACNTEDFDQIHELANEIINGVASRKT